MSQELIYSPTDFVGIFNQTLEYAYPSVTIVGELANFRMSKNRWVYFDVKDETASIKCFGTVYMLPGPLEDGLLVQIRAVPRLHPQFGFSLTVQTMQPVGEGSLKRASALLEAKLRAEGLFDPERKRPVPYPPERIGLIASKESAAYHDFIKILGQRWGGIEIELADVQVQGEPAPMQIVLALEYFNTHSSPVDVVVITRGGGSADDLAAFSTEQVTRAVAGSRIPTIVAIGHEVDISLAELAADRRASTPSNAAELLVPDKKQLRVNLDTTKQNLEHLLFVVMQSKATALKTVVGELQERMQTVLQNQHRLVAANKKLLSALSPMLILSRGYAVVRKGSVAIHSVRSLELNDSISIQLSDGTVDAIIQFKEGV